MPRQNNSEIMAQKEREAAQEILKQKKVKPAEAKDMIALPGGKMIDARAYIEARPAFEAFERIERFADYIKDYDPEKWTYAWPLYEGPYTDQTQRTKQLIRRGKYIKVKKSELKEGDIITHEGPGDDVMWYNHILVKMPKDFSDQLYEVPKAQALQKLVSHQEAISQGLGEHSYRSGNVSFSGGKVNYGE